MIDIEAHNPVDAEMIEIAFAFGGPEPTMDVNATMHF